MNLQIIHHKMQKISFFFFTILLFAFTSCTKIIDVDLNSADPQIAIEGEITNETGVCFVKITKTVNFSDPNTFPTVRNAEVTITDNTGASEILTETSPGYYEGNTLQGTPENTYTLKVVAEGKTFTSTCKMPKTINLQGIQIIESEFGGPGSGPPGSDTSKSYNVLPLFLDDVNVADYYRAIQKANGKVDNSFFSVTNDNLFNGQSFPYPIFNRDLDLKKGDIVDIEMLHYDKGAYEYFFSLGQVTSGQSGTPANPVSNIVGGALGYFSAHTVSRASGVVP
jgi:hypothetical protein